MLDEVCRGAGIRPADIRDQAGIEREFRKLEHVLFSARRTGERFTVHSVVEDALRMDADDDNAYLFPFRAPGVDEPPVCCGRGETSFTSMAREHPAPSTH